MQFMHITYAIGLATFWSARWWLTATGLALGGALVNTYLNRSARRARIIEERRTKIIGQLARGGSLEEMMALLARSLEESSSRIRCTITLAGPVYSPENYSVDEDPNSVFPIVDANGYRIGVLTVDPPLEKRTAKEARAIEGIRHLAAIIAEQSSMHSELQMLARRDRLTGLANCSAFAETLKDLIETAQPQKGVALFVFDLDRFQQINDLLGRGAGDTYLRQAAERIGKCFRPGDLIARLGADDFAVLAAGLSAAEAGRLSQSVINAFSTPFAIAGLRVIGSVSIGVSAFPGGGRTPDEVRLSADAALYEAKKGGGSRFIICSPEIRARVASIVNTERLIRQALDDNAFDLFYQAQMMVSGELIGLEALVRKRRPREAVHSASDSIYVAEPGGIDAEIGAWVVPEVIRQYAEWLHKGLNPVRIAIDMSRGELCRADAFDRIMSSLKTFGLGPETIQVQLTESAAILSEETCLGMLRQLRSAGISVALCVFGPGCGSPGALNGLPADAIKIDQSMVRCLTSRNDSMPRVSAMIAAARVLRMTVIAGGVETEEQMWALRRGGCHALQGRHIGHPLSAVATGEALADRVKTQRSGGD